MVVLGTDAHKRNHTVVAVDEAGVEIGSVTASSSTWPGYFDANHRQSTRSDCFEVAHQHAHITALMGGL